MPPTVVMAGLDPTTHAAPAQGDCQSFWSRCHTPVKLASHNRTDGRFESDMTMGGAVFRKNLSFEDQSCGKVPQSLHVKNAKSMR